LKLKTFTIWKVLDNIFKLRNRYNSINDKEEFEKLNIVVLTHRIDLVNQFRDDLVYWRDEKSPILSDDILNWLHISTYHSKADESDKNLDTEEFDLWNKEIKDNIIFSTYQTASSEKLVEKLEYIDIILIDESHNVKKDSTYLEIIKELSKKTRKHWEEVIILPVTATPNNHTREIFWEEKFNYWLEKYLNSEFSPNVEYNLITNSNTSKEIIEKLQKLVEQAKITQDFSEKKELIKQAEELFIEIMSSFNDDEELVDDLFERAWENWELLETVIFCESIEKADKLAKIITEKSGTKDFALSFHSKNDSKCYLTGDGIKNIEYKWYKINKLARITWYNLNDNLSEPRWFKLWLNFFFNKKKVWTVWKEEIISYFKTIKWNNEESYEYLMNLKQKDIQLIIFNKNNIRSLWTIMWFKSENWNRVENKWWFQEFIHFIYNKNSIEFNSDYVKQYFLNFHINSNKSYNYFINLKGKDLDDIKINTFWIIRIISTSWWDNPNNLKKWTIKHFKEFINWIFEKEETKN